MTSTYLLELPLPMACENKTRSSSIPKSNYDYYRYATHSFEIVDFICLWDIFNTISCGLSIIGSSIISSLYGRESLICYL
jgi:hypothetical protein